MRRWMFPAAIVALLSLAGSATAAWGFPKPVTERAKTIDDIYVQITIAGIIVFIVVFALMAYILVRFRDGSGHGRATFEHERDNIKAEAAWTIIPLGIVLWVGVISYGALVDIDGLGDQEMNPAVTLDITASQYAWAADYGNGVNVLAVADADLMNIDPFYVPADQPILFNLGAVDVIHSFNVHALRQTLDAVPGQINSLYVKDGLPAGEYFTQCKENCLNPGHAYMQARLIVVPQAEYDVWVEETLAGAGAGLQQVVAVAHEAGMLQHLGAIQFAKGASVVLQVANNDTATHTFTYGEETLQLDAGGFGSFELTADMEGTTTLTADDGQSLNFETVEPQTIQVDLGAFVIEPADLELQTGELYIFNVENTHAAVHNLFIGMSGGDGVTDALWNTGNLASGASESILVVPSAAGGFDTWCAIPGHYGLGMHGTLTIV